MMRLAIMSLCGLALAAGTAWGQQAEAPGEFKGANWVPWVYSVGFVLAIAAAAFKNSRRTHLD